MNERFSTTKLRFRVHLIRVHSKKGLTVRVLLVESTSAKAVYEGLGSWPKCRRWINTLSSKRISTEEFSTLRNLLHRKRLATIQGLRASLDEIEALGFYRADS